MITLTKQEAQQMYEVPLIEQLESVPKDARLRIDDADGMGTHYFPIGSMCHEAAEALRAKLSEPQREWQGLTDEEIDEGWPSPNGTNSVRMVARIIEAKLKEKNAI